MQQRDPIERLDTTYPELDLDAIEAQTVKSMGEIKVVDGFCSMCHATLNEWPDIEAKVGEMLKAIDEGNSMTATFSPACRIHHRPRSWIADKSELMYVLPFEGQTFRLDAATRQGCQCCGLILQGLKYKGWLSIYRVIEQRLQILAAPSNISLMVQKSENWASHELVLGFPGRLFRPFYSFLPIYIHVFPHRGVCKFMRRPRTCSSSFDCSKANEISRLLCPTT